MKITQYSLKYNIIRAIFLLSSVFDTEETQLFPLPLSFLHFRCLKSLITNFYYIANAFKVSCLESKRRYRNNVPLLFPFPPFFPFFLLIIIISVSSFLLVLITILAPLHITTFLVPCRNFSTNLFRFFPLFFSLSLSPSSAFVPYFYPFLSFFFLKNLSDNDIDDVFLKTENKYKRLLGIFMKRSTQRVRFNLSFTFKESNCAVFNFFF